MSLVRADLLLIRKNAVETRSKAADLIRRGCVFINGKPVSKPGSLVPDGSTIQIHQIPPFVSRGGDKINPVFDCFQIDVRDKIALDGGASTGGFTDCLLQRGVARVYAVDVGYGQLHWKLRQDHRVIVLERTNLRSMNPDLIPEPVDIVTLDVSFISLKLILPNLRRLIAPQGIMLPMVKPQFEAGKAMVGSGGVIRDPRVHRKVLEDMAEFFISERWSIRGILPSPVPGPKGNREFFFFLASHGPNESVNIEDIITQSLEFSESESVQ